MPNESKRAMEVSYKERKSMLRITVRNDESAKEARMIKSKVESNTGKWSVNKYDKGKQMELQPA